VSRVESDPHRPGFHFVPPGGWLNDPNGVGERDGIYHLFYQYNPHAAVHDRIHWGHAVSRDLVRWHDEPVALVPGPDGPDADGCWSGVLVDDDDTPTLVYSGHRHGSLDVMCLARGSADLREWRKDPTNPLLRAPDWLDLIAFRDHCVWRENGRWRQLIGAGIRGVGGSALLFESDDLRAWRFLGPLAVGDRSGGGPVGQPPATAEWTGAVWECIDFFRLAPDGTSGPPGAGSESAGVDVLLFSAWAGDTFHALCLTGTYTGDSFTPTGLHRFDLGEGACYAPQSFADTAGRRVVFGWIQEERPAVDHVAAGWAGAITLPRVMTLVGGAPVLEPASEVAQLRRDHLILVSDGAGETLAPGDRIAGPHGDQLDLELDLALAPTGVAHLTVRACASGAERTTVEIRRASAAGPGSIRLDRSASSLGTFVRKSDRAGNIPIGDDGIVRLRVLIDHSVLEIFANGQALTARVYPTQPDALATEVAVPASGPADALVVVRRFEAWTVDSIWNGPRR
jgi:beta-fructofuranosidase